MTSFYLKWNISFITTYPPTLEPEGSTTRSPDALGIKEEVVLREDFQITQPVGGAEQGELPEPLTGWGVF